MDAKAAESPLPKWLYLALGITIAAVYWLPRLFRGFWIDEAGTYWIAHNGFSQVWPQLQIYPGQSIIYMHLASLVAYGGLYKEALLRLPSIFGVLVCAWLLFKLTERIAGVGSGFLAVIPFLCAGAIVETGTNARPYALGMAVVLGSFLNLREWIHTNRTRALVGYCICSSLVVYFHYLFGMIFPVQIIYLVAARRRGRNFPWTSMLAVGCIVLLAALPLARQFFTIVKLSGNYTSPLPITTVTFLSFYPLHVLAVSVIALLLYRFLYPKWFGSLRRLEPDDLVLLATWLLFAPVVIFIVVSMKGYALFSTRYIVYALVPFFILLAWCLRQVGNERARFAVLVALALNAALYVPAMRQQEWRTPLAEAQRIAGAETPLLVRSDFIESSNRDLRGEPNPSSYVFAPLVAYPVPNEVIPVPFFVTTAAEQLLEGQIQARATTHRRFGLVATTGADVLELLPTWFRSHGYQVSALEVGAFTVVIFERT